MVSSIPDLRSPGRWAGSDKVWHLMEYAVLGGLLRRAFRIDGIGGWGVAVVAAAAVGALDELYQALVPGRFSSVYDWMADFAGAAIGSALAPIVGRWWTGTRARLKGMVE